MRNLLTASRRRYLYGIAIAAVPVLVLCGWLDPKAAPIVLPLIMAILNVSDDDR
jgi:hypothetical protein